MQSPGICQTPWDDCGNGDLEIQPTKVFPLNWGSLSIQNQKLSCKSSVNNLKRNSHWYQYIRNLFSLGSRVPWQKCSWTASSEFGTYSLCELRRFRRAFASAQSRQNLRCSLIEAANQEEPLDRKPDPRPIWMSGHAQLKFVMTECSKTQIRLTGLSCSKRKRILCNWEPGFKSFSYLPESGTFPDSGCLSLGWNTETEELR